MENAEAIHQRFSHKLSPGEPSPHLYHPSILQHRKTLVYHLPIKKEMLLDIQPMSRFILWVSLCWTIIITLKTIVSFEIVTDCFFVSFKYLTATRTTHLWLFLSHLRFVLHLLYPHGCSYLKFCMYGNAVYIPFHLFIFQHENNKCVWEMREFTVPYSKGLGYKSGRKECKKKTF